MDYPLTQAGKTSALVEAGGGYMTKQIKEFLLEEETGFANVEYDDGSTLRFNLV